ncbi:hypothetical protein CMO90_02265 [Candidatus Woesearchaeota archaeon]|jgi:16S rRNA (guanine(1405)-N(7))-methyltransferase|nr:hypothetical protein [Candidatus Woesearchaeota archaeon]
MEKSIKKFVEDIISKKELQNLDLQLVKEVLEKFFNKNKELNNSLEIKKFNNRSKEYKIVLKEIRKQLREIYGVFIEKNYSKRFELLKTLKKHDKKQTIIDILSLHKSTKERLPYYKEVYKKIFQITKKQKTIFDIGCGLNPISYFFLGYKPKYIASDISKKDLEFIKGFFKKINTNSKTIKIDLINEQEKLKKIKADICFLFKLLDSLETRKKHISKILIENIKCKWLVVSFSKTSLGGCKKIDKNKRNWLFNFIKKKGYFHKEFETPNELFIVIKK